MINFVSMKILMILFVLFIFNLNAQTSTSETIASGEFYLRGPEWKITKNTSEKLNVPFGSFSVVFMDMKYASLSQYESFGFHKKKDIKSFAEKLIEFGKMKEKKNITFEISGVKIKLYDFTKLIYLENEKDYYTTITRKSALKQGQLILEALNQNESLFLME